MRRQFDAVQFNERPFEETANLKRIGHAGRIPESNFVAASLSQSTGDVQYPLCRNLAFIGTSK